MKEDVIIAVQCRPVLWDKRNKRHHNRHVLEKEWKEISKELNVTEKAVKQIWKNLRQEFRKQFSKTIQSGAAEPETPTWKYFNSMAFLTDQFLPRKYTGNLAGAIPDDSDYDQNEESEGNEGHEVDCQQLYTENLPILPALTSESPQQQKSVEMRDNDLATRTGFKKRITTQADIGRELVQLEKEKLKLKKQKSENKANDEDVGFFNSLLPHVRTLNPRDKMLFRMKVQEILFGIAYPCDPSTSTVTGPRPTYHSTSQLYNSSYDTSRSTTASPSSLPATFVQVVHDLTSPMHYNQDEDETYVHENTQF